MNEQKTCSTCKTEKPETDFWFRSKKDGIRLGRCKACSAAYLKQWAATKPQTPPPDKKVCGTCGDLLSIAKYAFLNKSSGRRVSNCKDCVRSRQAAKMELIEPRKPRRVVEDENGNAISRTCTRCGVLKPIGDFGVDRRKKPGATCRAYCKSCRHAYGDSYVRKNRKIAQVHLLEYWATHPCVDCGEGDPVVLQFDHLTNKHGTVSSMVARGYKWETIEAEVAKCEVVCANCHTRRTARQQGWYKAAPSTC